VFFTDIFGLALPQNRLYDNRPLPEYTPLMHRPSLADSYAQAGYLVLLPDYFKGDPIPVNRAGFNMTAWRGRHPESEVTAIIDSTIKYARNQLGVKRLGAAGFCFGGPYVVRALAAGKGVDVGFMAHPGPISKAEFQAITMPLSIAAAGRLPKSVPKRTPVVWVEKCR
jgi:dienelactone hydrolase